MVSPILSARNLTVGYGRHEVLRDVSIEISAGEVVAIIGHNGAGKSTLLKALFGVLPISSGEVILDGINVKPSPNTLLRAGVTYAPQGNRIFPSLTVRQNLEIASPNGAGSAFDANLRVTLEVLPGLRDQLTRRAGDLSGGVRQMLALAMALIPSPRLLLLDEPSLGLAPSLAGRALNHVRAICRDRGLAAIVVEQKVKLVLEIADRAYVFRSGTVSFDGSADQLRSEDILRSIYF